MNEGAEEGILERIFRVFAISGDAKHCVDDPLRMPFAKFSESRQMSALRGCNEARLTSCLRGPYVDAPGARGTTWTRRHNLTLPIALEMQCEAPLIANPRAGDFD